MHDTVIRGGTIVDGTGQPAYHRRRGAGGRQDRPGRRQGRARQARDQGRGPSGHARLGRCPYPLRRPGHLGPGARALLLARRHHHPLRQLRRRLRPGAPHAPRRADRPDGVDRGDPRHRARRGPEVELGELPGLPGCAGRDEAHHRHRRADPAPPAARLRDGRARHQPGSGDGGRHRRDAPPDGRGHEGRRLRLHHQPHQQPQDADGRHGAQPLLRGGGADGHRPRAGRRWATAPSA